MSLKLAAQHLASRGRNGDTELVHMTKGEVAGLHALAKAHGGKLTINPDTGLPEAFFLAALLPTLFGAGAATAGAGALGGFFGSKLGIAALGAGLGALTNRRNPLMGAVMGGLGAFGGAGLAQGLIGAGAAGAGAAGAGAAGAGAAGAGAAGAGAAGAAGAGAAGAASAAPMASLAGVGGAAGAAAPLGSTLAGLQTGVAGATAPMASLTGVGGTSMGTAAANALGGAGGIGGAPLGSTLAGLQTGVVPAATSGTGLGLQAGSQLGVTGGALAPQATPALGPITPSPDALSPMQRLRLLGQGVRALGTSQGRDAFLGQAATKDQEATGIGGVPGLLKTGLAAAAPMLMAQPTTSSSAPASSGPNPYEYTYDTNTGQYTRVSPGTRDAMPATPPMFYADGGPVQGMSDRNEALTLMANGGQQFAAGGMSHLGDYSDGGRLLKGPGDGVSDSIPATIADKRPARLADGEFVVPARIVSELGNGSTEAGARKLYAMMDRIQKARGKTTGKDRVAVDSRAEKALPA